MATIYRRNSRMNAHVCSAYSADRGVLKVMWLVRSCLPSVLLNTESLAIAAATALLRVVYSKCRYTARHAAFFHLSNAAGGLNCKWLQCAREDARTACTLCIVGLRCGAVCVYPCIWTSWLGLLTLVGIVMAPLRIKIYTRFTSHLTKHNTHIIL